MLEGTAAIVRFGLLIVRPGTLIVTAPVFGSTFVPAPVRIGLGVLLGIVLAPGVPAPPVAQPMAIVLAVASEIVIGVAIGMGMRLIVAAAELGGHLVGFQMGLSYAALIDPQSGVRNAMVATLYANMAMMFFLAIDGHHTVLRALASSYAVLPIGATLAATSLSTLVAQMLGLVFVTGVRMAVPVVTVLLLVELALGLISRAAPSLNLMVVGAPIRLLAGLAALAVGVQAVPAVVTALAGPAVDITVRLLHGLA